MLANLPFTSLLPTAEKHGIPSAAVRSLWGSDFGLKVYEIPGEDHAVSSQYQPAARPCPAQQSVMPLRAAEDLLA